MTKHSEDVEDDSTYPVFYMHNRTRGEEALRTHKSNVLTTSKVFADSQLLEKFFGSLSDGPRLPYTVWSFLPKNLFEQFRKATNIYFLVMTVITFIPQISPIPGWTAAFPFALVLLAGMIKEAIEDYKRHKSDNEINNRPQNIIGPDGEPLLVLQKDIRVGDCVVIQNGDEVPADMLVLSTSDPDGVCYIMTAQLDGETNLKRHKPFRPTETMSHEQLSNLTDTRIYCAQPTFHLDEYAGAIELEGADRVAVDESNLILRGTTLKNTEWVIGCVCYAGFDTKIALNSRKPPSKYSTLNRAIDWMVIGIVAVQVVACMVAAGLASVFQSDVAASSAYLGSEILSEAPWLTGLKAFFSFLILTSYVVPQTLMISLEVAKLFQGRWIDWDSDMAENPQDPANTGAKARSTDQNDELGRVRWICSDKTGTLTANLMTLLHSVINGKVYDDVLGGSLRKVLDEGSEDAEIITEYMYALAVAHTVTIGDDDTEHEKRQSVKLSKWKYLLRKLKPKRFRRADTDSSSRVSLQHNQSFAMKSGDIELDVAVAGPWADIHYKGSSPDEEAFVKATLANGFVFKSRVRDDVVVAVAGSADVTFKLLQTIEFSSQRARMSVIVRHPNGSVMLYSKGADSKMIPLLHDGVNADLLARTVSLLDEHALQGLRTLIVGRKTLEEQAYAEWSERLRRIETGEDGGALEERKARVQNLYAEVEQGLDLLGVTSVEDQLQDQVPSTIAYFLRAGIRVVMITGDKQGTAINIARSTRLFTDQMTIVPINAKEESEVEAAVSNAEREAQHASHLAVVVDGATLKFLLKERLGYTERFYQLLHSAAAIVCCRTDPRQKAKVVALIRDRDKKAITLAVGDGGNDVNMIQKAHIGVGLFGKEGTQAARSSDYALREFKHLKKLIVVHGRWNYVRNATMVQYWVYKNVGFIFVLFWYGIHSAWSGQNYFDAWILTGYNVLFTSFPPLFFGFFEKDLSQEKIYENPEVYKEVQSGIHFTPVTFTFWAIEAFYVSLVCYFLPYFSFRDGGGIFDSAGRISGMIWAGNVVSIIGIVTVNLRMLIETREMHVMQHMGYWICFGFLLLALIVQSYMPSGFPEQSGIIGNVLGSANFWLVFMLTVVVCLLPAVTIKAFKSYFKPTDAQIIHEQEVISK